MPPCAFAELHDWSEPFVASATRAPARSADTAAARPGGAAADHEHVKRDLSGHAAAHYQTPLMRNISCRYGPVRPDERGGAFRERPLRILSYGIRAGAASGAGSSAGPSGDRVGSHSSHVGRYQFHSPSSFIAAGSSTARMIVASISTATARPKPICFTSISLSVANSPKTATMMIAALVTVPAVRVIALPDRVLRRSPGVVELLHPAEDEDVVVHRQAEQDHEQEEGQPARDRAVRLEAEKPLRPRVLEHGDEDPVCRADRQQVEQNGLDRDHDRPEREQQQDERERRARSANTIGIRLFICSLKSYVPAVIPVTAYLRVRQARAMGGITVSRSVCSAASDRGCRRRPRSRTRPVPSSCPG